jgi:hypothetical protein
MQLSMPSSLLHLVKMIEHDPEIKSQLENDRCKSDLTTAQLIMFNYHPNINKRTFSWEWNSIFCLPGVAYLCQNVVYQQKNLGESVFVLVELPWWIPNLRINAWSLWESCHSVISRARQANVQWFTSYLNSLKSETRKKRGTGIRRKVVGSGMTPQSWNNFLRLSEDKTELSSFLSERITSLHPSELVCVTHCGNVLINNNINRSGLCSCNHEEADTRRFVHAKHTTGRGLKTSLPVLTQMLLI